MKALMLCVVLAANAKSTQLNTEAFRLYQAGNFTDALTRFKEAFEADDSNALAHYNYAATLGVFRKQKKVCEANAYKGEILDHLEKALALDKGRKARVQKDADFDSIRDTVRYQKNVLGLSLPKDTAKVLAAVTWYCPAPGAYGNMCEVKFKPAGAVTVSVVEVNPEGSPLRQPHEGSWKVSGDKVSIDLVKPIDDKKHLEGKISPEGKIDFGAEFGPLADLPDECDA